MTLLKYLSTVHADKLTSTDHTILKNMNDQVHLIPNSTISELSQKIYTSSTSLHRLVKKLGFDGYTEFRYTIEKQLNSQSGADDDFLVASHYLSDTLDDIKITYELNETKLEAVVDNILTHEDIYCFGTGWKQKQIVDNFANDLLYYGHAVKTLRNTDDLEIASKQFNEDSLVIIVSLSGDLKNYKHTMKYLNHHEITTIGVSIHSDNPLANLATYSLQFVDSSLDIENHHWSSMTLNFIFDQLSHAVSVHDNS